MPRCCCSISLKAVDAGDDAVGDVEVAALRRVVLVEDEEQHRACVWRATVARRGVATVRKAVRNMLLGLGVCDAVIKDFEGGEGNDGEVKMMEKLRKMSRSSELGRFHSDDKKNFFEKSEVRVQLFPHSTPVC